ncbi:hypothetical protein CANINC_003921 [Pichia inconspicua]|uniref:Enhancer of translation termination 1 n=1 Tax=Pichia inconspicua TaxID=52247 RepID=A0A4V4NFC1_9ASCO|nr:hypothetical protein CANINC_003921 [[Candida] inconspicua]
MSGKRKLGLGKVKSKKQKVEGSGDGLDEKKEQLLTVELAKEVNPNDPLAQLVGLWHTWKNGERDNELILNGVINECDRIIRNCVENGGDEEIKLNDEFYSIYGQALSDISKFKPEDEMKEWIENAFERIESGFDKFGKDNVRLKLARCSILLTKIGSLYIGQMTIDSKKEEFKGLKELFDEFTQLWNESVKSAEDKKDYTLFKEESTLELLNIFDDLLDIVDKFGHQNTEVVDSDDEEEEGEVEREEKDEIDTKNALEVGDLEISEDHPLYDIQQDDSYNEFWRQSMLKFKEMMGNEVDKKVAKSVFEKLGQSYLMEAEDPIAFFSSYKYEREEEGEEEGEEEEEEMKEAVENARREGMRLVEEALKYLRQAHDEEDPKTWANIAEALITYGNLMELDSKEQEEAYLEAEKLLRRANNATHGHYEEILESLVGGDKL